MTRFMKKSSNKSGLPPGSLIHIGEKKTDKSTITIFDYDKDVLEEKTIDNISECVNLKKTPTVSWINITGLHDISVIEKIGQIFEIHPLVLEDILYTDQRPKYDEFDKYIFIVLKMLRYDEKTEQIITEQISVILTENYVISFQEMEGDVFNPIRDRIRGGKGRIRKLGTDYLTYSLIDAIVDNYFLILEKVGEKIEELEEEVISNPRPEIVQTIHRLKREMLFLRKSVWPLREVINNLQKNESKLIKKTTIIFLRDIYDHTIQVMDTVETYRDMISGLLDIYMSSISNKMNEVMKVLTIFAAIFIPLTFIAGIYGMNFDYMPELSIPWAYPLVWAIFIGIGLTLFGYFKHKKWV
jgi:magnesium transporter